MIERSVVHYLSKAFKSGIFLHIKNILLAKPMETVIYWMQHFFKRGNPAGLKTRLRAL